MKRRVQIRDIGRSELPVVSPVGPDDLFPLPAPYDKFDEQPGWKELSVEAKGRASCTLDGVVGLSIPSPETPEEERQYVDQFVDGTDAQDRVAGQGVQLAGATHEQHRHQACADRQAHLDRGSVARFRA